MPILWRVTPSRHAKTAFSGEGARLHGGRWNPKGVPVVYTSETRALAAMETLANLGAEQLLNDPFVCFEANIPSEDVCPLEQLSAIAAARRTRALNGWKRDVALTRRIGRAWAQKQASLALRVPSVVVAGEHNYLINPLHPRLGRLEIGPERPFEFDRRLVKTVSTEGPSSTP